ncbi:hypothetical protein PybrP1_009447 [[Pythium] brassicae (nom. inval.)]|nr:hypothetical protein PybrP1_009447 [[Pythium] brassicae (nom. inval.)]
MSANFDHSHSSGRAARPPKFFQKRRSVAPVSTVVTTAMDDEVSDAPEKLVFLNQASEFDFRALFRRTTPANPAAGEAISPVKNEKRRLRAREELCLMSAKTRSHGKKAWFLTHGYIGRDAGDNTIIATKDASMDPIHAEVLLDGDDYLIRDCGSSSGTFLCLSTINRHHPQRDGFRLRNGDTVLLGKNATIVVHEACTGAKLSASSDPHELTTRMERRASVDLTEDNDADGAEEGGDSGVSSRRVHFGSAVDATDGTLIIGNRYRRKTKRPNVYEKCTPASITISVTVNDQNVCKEQQLPGRDVYIIGSAAAACDILVPASGVLPVHARIVFDGCFFVLQDLSFEENPKRQTRVALSQPTRIGRGDCVLFGAYALHVVSVYRAFRDHEPDMKEVAFKCQLLRSSKRKARAKGKFIPFGFRHHTQDAFVFGKGRHCEGHIFTSALNVEQFAIQLDHGACSLAPRTAGINQGLYFLLGRDSMAHELVYRSDLVRYTSKALMLVEGSVFKCGNTEVEVVYVKNESQASVAARADEVAENATFLGKMPWIQQIALDRAVIENLARRGQRLNLQPGDAVYDEGDAATFLFIVISGDVELVARDGNQPNSWRLSAIERYLVPNDTSAVLPAAAPEQVPAGSFFGEICLRGEGLEYSESAKVATPCVLLALSRDDICGYLSLYLDIIEPHLAYESHKELLVKLRMEVPWLESFSYQDLRILASKAEHACFEIDESIVEDGVFQINSAPRAGGLLLLGYGQALLVGSKPDPTGDAGDDAAVLPELWSPSQPIVASDAIPIDPVFQNVQARSRVECFFFDSSHVAHLMRKTQPAPVVRESAAGAVATELRRASSNRRSSFVGSQQKARHSQVVMTCAAGADDDDESHLESADVEELSDPAQKWRRKKRNKNLLEKTVIETQQNEELPNAAVMYVLSGANRGDIHVVRNVATVGGVLSDADIELNDRYVSRRQAVIEHRDGRFWLYDTLSEWGTLVRLEECQNIQVYPGDVFVAGEVEFTCLAAFPVRKKTQICCIQ